jgi:hypothetical protein
VSFAHVNSRPSRTKLFGAGRPRPLDREAKVRVMHLARALMRRTAAGKAYGVITAKAFAVLQTLLFGFHNARTGLCFPSYEAIAEAAGCARSTVAEALKALEGAGVMSWVNRLKRIRETGRVRVIRTSNGYAFNDPKEPAFKGSSSKSEKQTGTEIQVLPSSLVPRPPLAFDPRTAWAGLVETAASPSWG